MPRPSATETDVGSDVAVEDFGLSTLRYAFRPIPVKMRRGAAGTMEPMRRDRLFLRLSNPFGE